MRKQASQLEKAMLVFVDALQYLSSQNFVGHLTKAILKIMWLMPGSHKIQVQHS